MDQRTEDWLAWRRKGIGASEAPIIMGVSPYSTIIDWWRDKMGLPPLKEKSTFIMDRGNMLEPIARARYSLLTNLEMKPALYQHHDPKYNHFLASLDGVCMPAKKGLEIKYNGKVDWEGIKIGIVPGKYMPQIQHQFFVTGLETIDYFGYFLPQQFAKDPDFFHRGESKIITCTPDIPYIVEYVQRAEFYWDFVKRGVEPPAPEKKARKKKEKKPE